jgi:hypothetical protein
VEHEWSEQFSEILAQAAAAGQAYAPTWYEGSSCEFPQVCQFCRQPGSSLSDSIAAAATPQLSSGSGGGALQVAAAEEAAAGVFGGYQNTSCIAMKMC